MNEPFPVKLSPVPIISAVVEIKFISNLPNDAVFGALYPLLNQKFSQLKKLPILQVPSDIRDRDPQFMNSPHYELSNIESNFLKVLIGPGVLAIVFNKSDNEYPGWTEYIKNEIEEIYSDIFQSTIIQEITRFGIRYTDFFDTNIFENTEFNIMQNSSNIALNEKIQIIRNFKKEDFMHNVVISNNASININGIEKIGSIIDIDSYIDNPNDDFKSEYEKYLSDGHIINKNQFFTILKKEFIDNYYTTEYEG
ncbi:MAG: TIGR04255 family protein [Sulfurovum sp.]